ncbi:hypothetical protein ABK040_009829 [Willaertia magna]
MLKSSTALNATRGFLSKGKNFPKFNKNTSQQLLTNKIKKQNVHAFAFDIDGVLLRGQTAIEGAKETIISLKKKNIPFVCLTNGGGFLEEKKCESVNEILGLNTLQYKIEPNQMILSHTPFQDLVPQYINSNVLIVGGYDCLKVAKSYGFNRAIHVSDYHYKYPFLFTIFPPTEMDRKEFKERLKKLNEKIDEKDRIDVVLFMYESDHLARDIQIIMDLMVSNNGLPGHTDEFINSNNQKQYCKLIMSNPDFLYSNNFNWPRFGQGMIKLCLQNIYKELTGGNHLEIIQYGKPMKVTFDFCEKRLKDLAISCGHTHIEKIYMCGDNPLADIRGANNAGNPWESVLVLTGVSKENDPINPAKYVAKDVYSFVMENI